MTLDILMLNIVIIPQTNGLLQAILMDSVSQADSDLEVVVLHHLPQAVVHGFNHLTIKVNMSLQNISDHWKH